MKQIAVITGDLVGSRRLRDDVFKRVLTELDALLTAFCTDATDQWQIFRGDSFQLTLTDARRAPLIALQIRWALKALSTTDSKVDARLAIGLAGMNEVSNILNTDAHILSGTALDELKNTRLKWVSSNEYFCSKIDLLTQFADTRITQLTPRQALALLEFSRLEQGSHQQLAEILSTSRVNATRLLNSADYNLLLDYGKLVSQWIGDTDRNDT